MKKKKQIVLICNNYTGAVRLAKQSLKLLDKTLRLKNVSVIPTSIVGGGENRKIKVEVIADTCYRDQASFTVFIDKHNFNVSYDTAKRKFEYV